MDGMCQGGAGKALWDIGPKRRKALALLDKIAKVRLQKLGVARTMKFAHGYGDRDANV